MKAVVARYPLMRAFASILALLMMAAGAVDASRPLPSSGPCECAAELGSPPLENASCNCPCAPVCPCEAPASSSAPLLAVAPEGGGVMVDWTRTMLLDRPLLKPASRTDRPAVPPPIPTA